MHARRRTHLIVFHRDHCVRVCACARVCICMFSLKCLETKAGDDASKSNNHYVPPQHTRTHTRTQTPPHLIFPGQLQAFTAMTVSHPSGQYELFFSEIRTQLLLLQQTSLIPRRQMPKNTRGRGECECAYAELMLKVYFNPSEDGGGYEFSQALFIQFSLE